MKTCKDCGQSKPLEEFNRHKQTRDGRNSYCKTCHRSRAKAWQDGPGKNSHAEAVKRWKRTTGAASRAATERRLREQWPEKAAYESPHVLDVIWLCSACHAAAHRVEVVR